MALGRVSAALIVMLSALASAQEQDSPDIGWPRVFSKAPRELTVYQPQVDSWKNYTAIHFRCANAVKGVLAEEKFGIAEIDAATVVDHATRTVAVVPQKRELRFGNVTDAEAAALRAAVLAEYHIPFRGLHVIVMGALVLSKVVLILEAVLLGAWVRSRPACVDVLARTALYSLGVLAVLWAEKAFEGRHEYGGFTASLRSVYGHADVHHVWANTICLSGALLVYNVMAVVRRNLGAGGLRRMFLSPLPEEAPVPAQVASGEQQHE